MAVIVIEIKEKLLMTSIVLHELSNTEADTEIEKQTAKDIREHLEEWFKLMTEDSKEK